MSEQMDRDCIEPIITEVDTEKVEKDLLKTLLKTPGGRPELGPIAHYPYWRYWCPECNSPWEGTIKREAYYCPCPDCYRPPICSSCGKETAIDPEAPFGILCPHCGGVFAEGKKY